MLNSHPDNNRRSVRRHYHIVSWPKVIRNIWFKVHLYIALTIGFFFVILGFKGSFNVFFFELEELGLPRVRHEAKAQPRSLDEIMQTVKAAHPKKKASGRYCCLAMAVIIYG